MPYLFFTFAVCLEGIRSMVDGVGLSLEKTELLLQELTILLMLPMALKSKIYASCSLTFKKPNLISKLYKQ